MERLAREMEQYRLAVIAVTETHLPGEGESLRDEIKGYRMIFSGRNRWQKSRGSRTCILPLCMEGPALL